MCIHSREIPEESEESIFYKEFLIVNAESFVLAFVMAGGRGSRLKILTKDTCKPDVNILGRNKIIDFVAANIASTGISATLMATQFKRESLSEYVRNGEAWGFDGVRKKLEITHPDEGGDSAEFGGTADSVRKSADRISKHNPSIVLVLGGDHIYSMDYRDIIMQHQMNSADITIMTNVVPDSKVSDFGIIKIDDSGRIIDFAEKPTDKEVIESFRLTPRMKNRLGIDDDSNLNFLASMGNYAFFWDRLKGFLDSPGMDFGKDIIPAVKENCGAMYAYVFNGYWRDVGKVRDYFNCNMEFVRKRPPFDLTKYNTKTNEKFPFYACIDCSNSFSDAVLCSCDVICRGSSITHSVLGHQVVVEEDCALDNCVLLGSDTNRPPSDQAIRECTMHIGRGSSLSHVILGKNTRIGKGVHIGPHNGTPEEREKVLQSIGLKPYRELPDGTVEGDFYIEPETGILVIGKQTDADPEEPILPDGLVC
jgi:glucose-1-phosphate adenylyltransferase